MVTLCEGVRPQGRGGKAGFRNVDNSSTVTDTGKESMYMAQRLVSKCNASYL